MKLKIMIGSFLEPCHQNIFKNNFSDDILEMFLEHNELEIAEAEVLINIFDIIIIDTYILGIMSYLFRRFDVQPCQTILQPCISQGYFVSDVFNQTHCRFQMCIQPWLKMSNELSSVPA